MEILITGKNSYIGESIIKHCSNNSLKFSELDVRTDIWKKEDFSKYDTIIHLAAIVHKPNTSEEIYEKVNFELALNIAQKAKNENIKQFIFFSTESVYGKMNGKIDFQTKENPSNYYGKSKLKAEIELLKLQDENFKICIIRPPMVYGKGCKGNYCTLSKIARKFPIFPNIENKRSMIYIENLCEFVKLMIINRESGKFFPQDKEFVNTANMVRLISKENNHNIRLYSFFNFFVKLIIKFPGKIGKLCNKAFGDLYYDMTMSEYKQNYRVKTFEQAIHETEN